jgi:outer membrane protein assembly factor BamA
VDYHYFYEVELDNSSSGNDAEPEDFSENLGLQSGLGIKISMEGRDNRLNAKHGFFIDAGFQVFDKFLGGDFNFKYVQADLRYYFTPLKKLTIATQARTESKQGNVPVQSLAFLGGDYTMRGIYLGRYRDKVSIDSQVELRFPIFWILGGTVFGGAGQVAPEYGQMSWDSFHYCYGTGLRLKVDSKHDINLRFDMGFSADQNIFIMNFSEAF